MPRFALQKSVRDVSFLVALTAFVGMAGCFRALDMSKIPCKSEGQCPAKHTCAIPTGAQQGICVLGGSDGSAFDQRISSGSDGQAGADGKTGGTAAGGSSRAVDAKGAGGSSGAGGSDTRIVGTPDAGEDAPVASGGVTGGTSTTATTAAAGTVGGESTASGGAATGGVATGGSIVTGGTITTGGTSSVGGSVSSSSSLLAKGSACSKNEQCSTTFCVDGVCCDGKCDGNCEACAKDGSCGFSSTPRKACGGEGKCAGECKSTSRSACTFPTDSTVCAAQTCSSGVRQNKSLCDGKGACVAPTEAKTNCSGGQCLADGSDCATCTDDLSSVTCSGGHCGPTTNNCGHSVSCNASCSGTGQTCGGGGTPGLCGCISVSKDATCGTAKCGTKIDNCGKEVSCGTCSSGSCVNGACCTPSCSGKCGGADDGCGGTCAGTSGCSSGQVCKNQACCSPNCSGKCNGGIEATCGTACSGTSNCSSGQVCTSALSCCTPNCTGKCGGDNGCGGTCPNNCTSPDTCGGGGTANVCGCSDSSACTGKCGTITNKCNKQVTCQGCTGNFQCTNNTCQCPNTNSACGTSCTACTTGIRACNGTPRACNCITNLTCTHWVDMNNSTTYGACGTWDFETSSTDGWAKATYGGENITSLTYSDEYAKTSGGHALKVSTYESLTVEVPLCNSGDGANVIGLTATAWVYFDTSSPSCSAAFAFDAYPGRGTQVTVAPYNGWAQISATFADNDGDGVVSNMKLGIWSECGSYNYTMYIDNVRVGP